MTEETTDNTTTNMTCMVRGCKKTAIDGTIDLALCEDHLHLAYKTRTYVRKFRKIGRNELCFCGSTKKFKKCCGK